MRKIRFNRNKLAELNADECRYFDDFIISNGGTPFHEVIFNAIAMEYFKSDAELIIASDESNGLVGVCIVHFFKRGFLREGFSGLCNNEVPYGGWIFDKDKVCLDELLVHTLSGINEKIHYYSNACFEVDGYYRSGKFKPNQTVVVDLSKDLDVYFETELNSHTRNKIRKAQKSGVITKHLVPQEMNIFYEISEELKQRVGMKNEYPFYRQVFDAYYEMGRCTCIAEEYRGEIVSAGIMLFNKNVSVGWVAARKSYLPGNLYQNELLLWDSIIWSKDKGCAFFDLSGLDEQKHPQLARIKLSISKDVRCFYSATLQNLPVRVISKMISGRKI
jgi:hypothetical protein